MPKLSKAQHGALKEVARGETRFGPGFLYKYQTGKALVDRGLAESIEDKEYGSSSFRKGRRPYLKARITLRGRDVLSRDGCYIELVEG